MFAGSSIDNWKMVRRAWSDDPEVNFRLRSAWRSQSVNVVEALLPPDYPMWPDIDQLHLILDCTLRDVRIFLKDGGKDQSTKHTDLMARRRLPYLHPSYRLATRSWAAWQLARDSDEEYIRHVLERMIIAEKMAWNSNGHPLCEVLHNDPDATVDLLETFPEIINWSYYDGRRSNPHAGTSGRRFR